MAFQRRIMLHLPLHERGDGGRQGLGLQHLILVFFRGHGALHRVRGDRVRGGQHLACHAIGFLLVRIVSGADGQFSLKTDNLTFRCKPLGLNQLRHTPVAHHPLQLEERRESALK